jgi:hypothetical protein
VPAARIFGISVTRPVTRPAMKLAGESTTSEMGKPSLAVWTGSRRHRLDPISAAQRAGVARLH